MPLPRLAARRANHKDEVSPLLVLEWRGRGRLPPGGRLVSGDDLAVDLGPSGPPPLAARAGATSRWSRHHFGSDRDALGDMY